MSTSLKHPIKEMPFERFSFPFLVSCYKRALDLRTSTRTRFNLNFLRVFAKKTPWKTSFYSFFSPEKLVRLFILKEVKPSPDNKLIRLLTFDNLFPPLYDMLAKTRSGSTTAISFSLQNKAGSRVSTN